MKKLTESDYINYVAGMLDEAMDDKSVGRPGPVKKPLPQNPDDYKADDLFVKGDEYEDEMLTRADMDNMMEEACRAADDEECLNERRMNGPAAARTGGIDEIADMRHKLATGVVEFNFMKHSENGDVMRHAIGTTNEQIIPVAERRRLDPTYDENVASYERRAGFIIWFWDLEKNAVRCFNTNRFEGIENYTVSNQRADRNQVQRFGDIYVHRDIDPGMEDAPAAQQLSQENIDTINNELPDIITGGSVGISDADLDFGDGVPVQLTVENGEPVLRIEIRKRGTENDPPYQLRINAMRNEIRERWGVVVRRVEVTGSFQY